jgi:hypothetical protein
MRLLERECFRLLKRLFEALAALHKRVAIAAQLFGFGARGLQFAPELFSLRVRGLSLPSHRLSLPAKHPERLPEHIALLGQRRIGCGQVLPAGACLLQAQR